MNKRSGTKSKKKILHVAMKVFSSRGFAGANIRDIAKAAGISVGGVYLYFRNKEDLYLNLINEMIDDFMEKTEGIASSDRSQTDILSAFLKTNIEYARRHREFILVHIREHCFTFGREKKREFIRNQKRLLERIIQQGIRKGEFRRCNARETSNIIMGTLRGIATAIALDDDVVITAKGVTEHILQGLLSDKNKLRRE